MTLYFIAGKLTWIKEHPQYEALTFSWLAIILNCNCLSQGVRAVQGVARLTAWIAGSNPAEGMDYFRLLCLLCVVHVATSATS
jgi:hypothetical protein